MLIAPTGCYKFGDPLLAEEGDDSLDEEGGRGGGGRGRVDDDSDDQFADDEAASNQGDSSSQEYLEDHYAGEWLLLWAAVGRWLFPFNPPPSRLGAIAYSFGVYEFYSACLANRFTQRIKVYYIYSHFVSNQK